MNHSPVRWKFQVKPLKLGTFVTSKVFFVAILEMKKWKQVPQVQHKYSFNVFNNTKWLQSELALSCNTKKILPIKGSKKIKAIQWFCHCVKQFTLAILDGNNDKGL